MEIILPQSLGARSLGELYRGVVLPDGSPAADNFQVNFSKLHFIEPTGITGLSNFFEWLNKRKIPFTMTKINMGSGATIFLDDSNFFKRYLGSPLRKTAQLRKSTIPLSLIDKSHSHMWLRGEFFRWLAKESRYNIESFDLLNSAFLEVFHNISNHSTENIGSACAQFYPGARFFRLSISDFGVGIPFKVKQVLDENEANISDAQAIKKACQLGFTSRSVSGNAGRGLPHLIDAITTQYNGSVTIISYGGTAQYATKARNEFLTENVWTYPGCMIDIKIEIKHVPNVNDNREEYRWL